MGNPQLTQRQKKLLYQLVDHYRNGRLIEPFGIVPIGASEYAIYLRYHDSMHLHWASDLDVLCVCGYLDFQWNRLSNAKLYSVSKTARQLFLNGQLAIEEESVAEPPSKILPLVLSPIRQNRVSLLQAADILYATLKREMGEILEGVALGNAIAEITAVQDMYYMILHDVDGIIDILHPLGERITAQLATATTLEDKLIVAQTLESFGSWRRLIFQLLLETKRQLGKVA